MELYIFFLIPIFILLTVVALGFGLYGMVKGGKYTGDFSNRMMRHRILFQFLAVAIIMLFLYLSGNGPN